MDLLFAEQIIWVVTEYLDALETMWLAWRKNESTHQTEFQVTSDFQPKACYFTLK
jgi:hypothetical protein